MKRPQPKMEVHVELLNAIKLLRVTCESNDAYNYVVAELTPFTTGLFTDAATRYVTGYVRPTYDAEEVAIYINSYNDK